MVVCHFFLRGQCRYGSNCPKEHPTTIPSNTPAAPRAPAAQFTMDAVKVDLTSERPSYALTSYGPGKYTENLIKDIDQSPEELRWEFYQARATNNPSLYPEASLVAASESAVQNILRNFNQAYQYALTLKSSDGTLVVTAPSTFGSAPAQSIGFGNAGSAFGGNTFGGSNAFGAAPSTNAFGGGGAFGSTASTTGSAFGSGGTLGTAGFGTGGAFGNTAPATGGFGAFSNNATPAAAAPAFGQSAFAPASTGSAFGTTAPVSGFGAPAFGQPSTSSAFGAPAFGSTAAPSSAFGSSAFGSVAQPTSAFGQSGFASAPIPASAPVVSGGGFGAFSGGAAPSAFGSSGFGSAPSAFGSGGVIGVAVVAPVAVSAFGGSAFGAGGFINNAPTSTNNAFGGSSFGSAPAVVPPSAFSSFGTATATPFGQSTAISGFGQPPAVNPSPFGQSTPAAPTAFSAFGQQNAFSASAAASAPPASAQSKGKDPYAAFAPLETAFSEIQLSAYQADKFVWGAIPLLPPPISLR